MALMTENLIKYYGPILERYNIPKPDFIEENGKVKKVSTKNGIYALKSISTREAKQFPTIISKLYHKGFTRIVPLYSTRENHYITQYDNKYHYLMPWFSNELRKERDERHQMLFRELAKLHTYSAMESAIKESDVTEHYQFLTNQWEKQLTFLEKFVTNCEEKWYMSPFELQFCTFYHEMVQAGNFARVKLDEWYEMMKEKKKVRTVLNHGKVSVKHFLFDEKGNGYFCNFEKAKMASPINDLVSFYYRTLHTYPVQSYECLDWLSTYRKYFKLKEEELTLLLSYMTFPEPLYRCALNYSSKNRNKSERQYVRELQISYWQMKNIEFIVTALVEEERRIKELELQEQLQQEEQSHT